ncbi:RNA-binding protein, putative [Bodo saltans]|uniref:RNA-binding protein, putative n=1 Tax=Bodo saltans TaxID=75058 RepID=A0A0S4JMB7_BODSA|nr:RNA-binding protein, putative [Bodo saltans]|eukprot:CUG89643.1 RNA-binding protein, putative [Bodo saltans]
MAASTQAVAAANSAAAATPASPAQPHCFVYVNNERVELMEDRRLFLLGKYPEGTILVDPSFMPPRPVPMSTLDDERGVTLRKLLPNSHYHAFRVDPNTGERVPVHVPMRYLVVHNLPSNATAELIGKFFEQFDFIVESDIIKPPGHPNMCKGRGYVQFANADTVRNVLMQYRTLQLSPTITAWLDYSDTKPRGTTSAPPPQYHQTNTTTTTTAATTTTNVASTASSGGTSPTVAGAPVITLQTSSGAPVSAFDNHRSNNNNSNNLVAGRGPLVHNSNHPVQQHHNHHHHHTHALHHHHHHHSHHHQSHHTNNTGAGSGSILPAPAPPAAVATTNPNTYYFVTYIYEEHIQTSIRDGIFWPTKTNQRTFYQPLEHGGVVYLIFLLMHRPTLYGYARVTYRDMVRNKSANFTLEWIKHSVFSLEADLKKAFPQETIFGAMDGTSLKPDVGQAVCDYLEAQPSRTMPTDLPYINNSNSNSSSSPTASGAGTGTTTTSTPSVQRTSISTPTSAGGPSNANFVPQPRSAQSPTSQGTPLALPRSHSSGRKSPP